MYIPLRIFSPFSIGFGTVTSSQIESFCRDHDIPAVAIADKNTLSGSMSNTKDLKKAGIQPIYAITLGVSFEGFVGDIGLYAKSDEGRAAILSLANYANTNASQSPPSLKLVIDTIENHGHGVVVTSGGLEGLGYAAAQAGKLKNLLDALSVIPDTFVEIERREHAEPSEIEHILIDGAQAAGLPLVATCTAAYATPDLMDAHDTYLCISSKTYKTQDERPRTATGLHLATPEEMKERFKDLPNALANTIEIARKTNFIISPVTPHTPAYHVESGETEEGLLRKMASDGLSKRLLSITPDDPQTYSARLDYELDIIVKMGFAGYFLIVADFISWAKASDIPVGPGRGSGAGSLVAYSLGITDINPLEFGLLFERFLNPQRVSLPDFDVDFCQERRDEVIEYVRTKYGKDKVAHIAAYGSLQARAVVRAVGRAMQIPYPVVDRYVKMIPQNPANPVPLADAMELDELSEELDTAEQAIVDMFQTALRLEGLFSHVSTHAAGVIISDVPIADVVPVHIDQHGKLATSFEMKAAEAAGLVKFDFLGLKNLDAIHSARKFIQDIHGAEIDFDSLNFKDEKTYASLAGGDGFAVFQLESSGMCRAMRDLKVQNIDELIALISLYRPGPMDQIPTYAAIKSGTDTVHYAHPELEKVLSETNGVMIYQEQVMQIARSLSGYDLGEADLLRRAMGKKIASEMDAQKERFCSGTAQGWVDVELDNGASVKLHALTKLPVQDGSGTMVTLQQAMENGIEVSVVT